MHCVKAWSPFVTPSPLDKADSHLRAIPPGTPSPVRNSAFALATYHICRSRTSSPVDETRPLNRPFL